VALRAAGYEILGGVMGASVEHLSLVGYRAKDWATDRRWEPDDDPPLVSTDRRYPFPLREYALALQSGWDVALDRLTAACRGIGGDGVVGIVVSEQVPSRGNKISCSPVPPCGEAVIGGRARTFLTTLGGSIFRSSARSSGFLVPSCSGPPSGSVGPISSPYLE
jgi:hypothetical protein